jgi:hypothetical protein
VGVTGHSSILNSSQFFSFVQQTAGIRDIQKALTIPHILLAKIDEML